MESSCGEAVLEKVKQLFDMRRKRKTAVWLPACVLFVYYYVWSGSSTASSSRTRVPRDELDELVERIMRPWRKIGVSRAAVDAALLVNAKQDAGCFMIQYVDKALYTVGEADSRQIPVPGKDPWNPGELFRTRRENILILLKQAVRLAAIPNFEAVFCLHDCVVSQSLNTSHSMFGTQYEYVADPIPAFTVVTCVDSMNIPFPTWDYAAGYFADWPSRVHALAREEKRHPWKTRKGQAVFRGGQRSCVLYPEPGHRVRGTPFYHVSIERKENAKHCGRNALLYQALTSKHNHLFNVSLTDGIEWWYFSKDFRRSPDEPQFLSKEEQETFKYQIIAEGECQWANRLRDALFMGTALIVQDFQCVEYYGMDLRPWVHYIPVDYWFYNLTGAVLWAERNPDAVLAMIAAKQAYARRYLMPDRVVLYVSKLLRVYSSLLKHPVELHAQAQPFK